MEIKDETRNEHARDHDQVSAAIAWVNRNFTKPAVWKIKNAPSTIMENRVSDDRKDLKDRIENPQQIAQGQTNTCGPAAFWYLMAYYRPMDYAKAVTELYSTGQTELGKLKLKPDQKVLDSLNDSEGLVRLIDWIALVSLKNHTSTGFGHPTDQFSAMTLPGELQGWLTSSGSSVVNIQTSIGTTMGLGNLRAATLAFESGSMVCLFVKAKSLEKVDKTLWGGVDHWVVLVSPVMVRQSDSDPWLKLSSLSGKGEEELLEYQIKLGYSSWGWYGLVQPLKGTTSGAKTVGDWLGYYYGYMAARV